jgi:hypothetical protein
MWTRPFCALNISYDLALMPNHLNCFLVATSSGNTWRGALFGTVPVPNVRFYGFNIICKRRWNRKAASWRLPQLCNTCLWKLVH